MMLEAIKGTESTVPVTSLSAYIFLSAGTKLPIPPTKAMPIFETWSLNFSNDIDVWKPLMDSNLSMVPPVWPKPRPLILATLTPNEATSGAKTMVVLSPTPPVECLSVILSKPKFKISPLWSMMSVKFIVSSSDSPSKSISVKNAAIW